MLPVVFPGVTAVTDLIAAFRQKHQEVKMLFGEVERLITLLLVVPVFWRYGWMFFYASAFESGEARISPPHLYTGDNHLAVLGLHVKTKSTSWILQEYNYNL